MREEQVDCNGSLKTPLKDREPNGKEILRCPYCYRKFYFHELHGNDIPEHTYIRRYFQ